MGEYKTPGVYIKEKNAFGNSVVEAATAIPAFIGYTEKALNGNDDLTNVPWKISSMTEFIQYFGGAPKLEFDVDIVKYHPEAKKDGQDIKPTGAILKPSSPLFQFDLETTEKEELVYDSNNSKKTYQVNYAFCINGDRTYTLYYNMLLFLPMVVVLVILFR